MKCELDVLAVRSVSNRDDVGVPDDLMACLMRLGYRSPRVVATPGNMIVYDIENYGGIYISLVVNEVMFCAIGVQGVGQEGWKSIEGDNLERLLTRYGKYLRKA